MKKEKAVLLVDARDAAKMLAVSPRKLWSMTFEDSPGLPYVRVGRLVRYSPEDLRQWIIQSQLAEAKRRGLHLTTADKLDPDGQDSGEDVRNEE